ncbi:signal recognition particle-docking protein FtsY [Magnetococcales bacterium HHB-1]
MGLFQRFKKGLAKTRQGFVERLDTLLDVSKVDDDLIEELEMLLIAADFGVTTTETILAEAKENLKSAPDKTPETFRTLIQQAVKDRFPPPNKAPLCQEKPHVILVVGVNGVGKTTTIGKLAATFTHQNKKVLLAAGDTFRAAAVEQLQIWGRRTKTDVISQGQDADSASVIFDAHAAATARDSDILLADTAGRLHTKSNLMEELKKIKRVLNRKHATAPQDIWLVLDATTGQNAMNQVEQFHKALNLTGLVVTKLDGTAKGGAVVGISERFSLPIHYIGVGEGVDDLRPFDADLFVDALFAR